MFKRRRSIKLGKGVRLNVGKKGITSVSVGGKGVTLNASKKGVKGTASIRGTGISTSGYLTKNSNTSSSSSESSGGGALIFILVVGFFLW